MSSREDSLGRGAGGSVCRDYDAWAEAYDSDPNRTRDLDARIMRETFAGRRMGEVVEIGCGTGKNTELLAAIGSSVLAIDFSRGMLDRARAKIRAGHVRFAQGDITEPWPVERGVASLVACNLVLEHVAELGAVFAEAARVLAPGGEFFVCELHPVRQHAGRRAEFARGGDVSEIASFPRHVSDYTRAARASGLEVRALDEWWDAKDPREMPRLISFLMVRA